MPSDGTIEYKDSMMEINEKENEDIQTTEIHIYDIDTPCVLVQNGAIQKSESVQKINNSNAQATRISTNGTDSNHLSPILHRKHIIAYKQRGN
jgi:hypothetical protein